MSGTWTPEQLAALRGLQEDLRREFWERLRAAGAATQPRSGEDGAGGLSGA